MGEVQQLEKTCYWRWQLSKNELDYLLRGLKYDIGKIITTPHTSREILKQQQFPKGSYVMIRRDYRKLLLALYFPSWSARRGFSNSVDRSMATYTIELPTALMITYALSTPLKTLFLFCQRHLSFVFPQVCNSQLSLVCDLVVVNWNRTSHQTYLERKPTIESQE